MSLPYQNYVTGVSGYKASNKAAIVVKGGWIVGEYYNQSGANKALYYTASNGKTFAMLLAGHMAQTYPQLGFGPSSKLYDQRWLPQGFPLSDSRKSAITLDHVFRHVSGIIPEDEHRSHPARCRPSRAGISSRSPSGRTPSGPRARSSATRRESPRRMAGVTRIPAWRSTT